MARKNNGRILSGGVIVACTVLLCTLNVSAQFQASEVTHTISGSVGIPNVIMKGLPDNPVTDADGYYISVIKWGWSGTVKPEREGYTFDPQTKSFTNVTSDQVLNFTAGPITYTIAGTVGMEGVRMSGLPGEPVTGPDGSYSVKVPFGWGSVVRPMKDGFEFTPDQKQYEAVKREFPREVYTGKPIRITISGSAQVEGVVMQGLPGNVVSGRDGAYTTTVDWNWSGTVMPSMHGYNFTPTHLDYSAVFLNQIDQDGMAVTLIII